MDESVLAVLAAYQNNLTTSKMMTSPVVQCLRVENVPKIRLLAGKSFNISTVHCHLKKDNERGSNESQTFDS